MDSEKGKYYKAQIRKFSALGKAAVKRNDYLDAAMYINAAKGFTIKLEKLRGTYKPEQETKGGDTL